jgi:hypothetical protein
MPKTGYPFVQSAFTLFVLSAQRFDVKRTMAYVSWAARASAVPIRQYIDHRYNERVTGLTRVGNMIRVKVPYQEVYSLFWQLHKRKLYIDAINIPFCHYEMDRSQS